MYFILLPLLDLYGNLSLNYAERLDMIKTSLMFRCGMKNTTVSYLLLCLEIISFSVHVFICYAASIKLLPLSLFYVLQFLQIMAYITFSMTLYLFFDEEDYRNSIRVNEVLDAETVERLESGLTNEEVENSQQISVPTSFLNRRNPSTAGLD